MVKISGREIRLVRIIDDDKQFRDSLADTVAEAHLEPVQESGPLGALSDFADRTARTAHAALCDHHLRRKNYYSTFNGAEAVSALYKRQIPALLCTRWDQANIEEIRGFRRFVPVLLKPSEIDPDSVVRGLAYCIDEFNGRFRQNRRPSRALVRVEDLDKQLVYIVVPAFAPDEVIRIFASDLPGGIKKAIENGQRRFHAQVNLGADSHDQLFLESWEGT
jgi:hypothetical protein